jgi:hypothetical protein
MSYRSVAAIALLALPAFCQSPMVLHSGEAIFTIAVHDLLNQAPAWLPLPRVLSEPNIHRLFS